MGASLREVCQSITASSRRPNCPSLCRTRQWARCTLPDGVRGMVAVADQRDGREAHADGVGDGGAGARAQFSDLTRRADGVRRHLGHQAELLRRAWHPERGAGPDAEAVGVSHGSLDVLSEHVPPGDGGDLGAAPDNIQPPAVDEPVVAGVVPAVGRGRIETVDGVVPLEQVLAADAHRPGGQAFGCLDGHPGDRGPGRDVIAGSADQRIVLRADGRDVLGQAVNGGQGRRREPQRTDCVQKVRHGTPVDALAAAQRDPHTGQVQLRVIWHRSRHPVGEVRRGGVGATFGGQGAQPAGRAERERRRWHQREIGPVVQRVEEHGDQAHVVIQRQPGDQPVFRSNA